MNFEEKRKIVFSDRRTSCITHDLSEESHDDVYHNVVARSKKDPQQDIMTNIDIAMSGHASDKMIEYIREKELLVAELV